MIAIVRHCKCTESVIRDERVPDLAYSLAENMWNNSDYYYVVGQSTSLDLNLLALVDFVT